MKKILIINTGGTFNKVYNPKSGMLDINNTSHHLDEIASKWLCDFKIINIIGKDSLDMTMPDREVIVSCINNASQSHIIIVHGTDTMDITAAHLASMDLDKYILITGSMVPYSIDPVEATANLSCAYGFLQNLQHKDIYISMNAHIQKYDKIQKDRTKGKFITK
jgi:L-asparaginase